MTDPATQQPGTAAAVFRGDQGRFDAIPDTRFEMRELGLATASGRMHTARLFRATSGGSVSQAMHLHDADFQYLHILKGEMDFQFEGNSITTLRSGDAIWLPKGCHHRVTRVTDDLEFLEIFSPADVATLPVSD